jgi:hypothetical protein
MLVANPQEEIPLGRPRRRWEDVKISLLKISWYGADWT